MHAAFQTTGLQSAFCCDLWVSAHLHASSEQGTGSSRFLAALLCSQPGCLQVICKKADQDSISLNQQRALPARIAEDVLVRMAGGHRDGCVPATYSQLCARHKNTEISLLRILKMWDVLCFRFLFWTERQGVNSVFSPYGLMAKWHKMLISNTDFHKVFIHVLITAVSRTTVRSGLKISARWGCRFMHIGSSFM